MLAIVPARGGSKGLPGKNIRDLHGIPLIAHTIKAALAAKSVSRVVVSTDDSEIYEVGLKYGASSSFLRPAELATDDALAVDVYLYTIDRLQKETGQDLTDVVILQPTSPLRNAADIDSAIDLYKEKQADSVISYTEEHHPIFWHRYLNESLVLEPIFSEELKNRQQLRKSYYPNGAVYVFKKDLLKKRAYYSDKTFAYLMPRNRSVDIDTLEDFQYAEFLMGRL